MGHGIRNAEGLHEPRPVSLGELIHEHVRHAIEVAVGEELAIALAARPYERNGERRGYRNGRKTRTVTGPTGPLPLTLPRATVFGPGGAREWRSTIVPRYARGRGERRRRGHVSRGHEHAADSRRAGPVAQRRRPLQERGVAGRGDAAREPAALDEPLPGRRGWDRPVPRRDRPARPERRPRRELAGAGRRRRLARRPQQLLALECCGAESAPAWRGFIEDLARRGLAAPLLCIIDGNPGLRRALGEIWPTALVQRCCVHKLRNLERKAPKHALAELRDDFHRIVYAAGADAARAELTGFERKWAKRCPGVVRSLQEGGAELLTFFTFPRAQWKTLRTTNVIERLNGEFRRRVKTQSALPSEDTAVVLLFSLVASGQIRLRRIDGWRKIATVLRQRARVAA